jgi:hypothetical protein
MTGPGIFSGPPSNKAVGSTFAVALTTLFFTIAAHTFWKSMSTADMTLYITTASVVITGIVSYFIGESGSYAQYRLARIASKAKPPAVSPAPAAAVGVPEAEARFQRVEAALQQLQAAIAQAGLATVYAIPPKPEVGG